MDFTSANVARGIFSSIRSQPASNGIDINAIAHENALLAHCEDRERLIQEKWDLYVLRGLRCA